MRLPKARKGLAAATVLALAAVASGCSEEAIMQKMDRASRDRLERVPADSTVLVSVRADSIPPELPSLGDRGRELTRVPGAVLVEIRHGDLAKLDAISGIEDAAFWAPGDAVHKIDGWFRRRLLTAWAAGDTTAIPVTVTFPPEAEAARKELEAVGAEVRTVAGPVATLAGPPEVLFRVLGMKRLASLQGPRPVRMLDRP
jgi:hypothetical protein